MTNLELYKLLTEFAETKERHIDILQREINIESEHFDRLNYEISEIKSQLTDEELATLEVF